MDGLLRSGLPTETVRPAGPVDSSSYSDVLLEAMAAGLPIVTTEVGESRNVIGDSRIGRIVKARNPGEMADALSLLIDSQELRRQMGSRAKQRFTDNFGIEKMISRYQAVYESLC